MSDATSVLYGLEMEFGVIEVTRLGGAEVKIVVEMLHREGACLSDRHPRRAAHPLSDPHPRPDRQTDCRSKGTDLRQVTPEELIRVADEINKRPRRTLAWARPADLPASETLAASA